ncbi:MAG: group II intron reverse transcriptase/maturase [Polyangiales bacterium]
MAETSGSGNVCTKLQRIAKLAKEMPGAPMTTLAHHIDVEWLHEAYRRTRKDGAVGVDGQSAEQYAEQLEGNLRSLCERAKSGTYRAPPVRRVHIPKGDGTQTRPIGIPTFEDKVLQRAVAMVLEAVYEQDFLNCSFGFRPERSAHQALVALREATMKMGGGWVVEVDISKFFDTLDHALLMATLRQRIRDGVLLRLVSKWLHAGVLEAGETSRPDAGTPQGGVISPLLANVYLHEVLDTWFVREVQPRLHGRATLVRYADDFVIVLSDERDARRVMDVLPKRFGKYGLTLHPEKTKLVAFRRPSSGGDDDDDDDGPGSFDLLGFNHHWRKSRKGNWVVYRKTAKRRLAAALRRVAEWCRANRHAHLVEQWKTLVAKLRGHYAYFGITGNARSLERFFEGVQNAWRKWLDRRSSNSHMTFEEMRRLLVRYPLPKPTIVHRLT